MKLKFFIICACAAVMLPACSMFKPKYGCPSNGSNIGAEKLLNEQPKKIKKFKA